MPRSLHKLVAAQVSAAKPRERAYGLADGGGLLLWVSPQGARVWRYRYRHDGRPKTLSLGAFPDVSLAGARERHHAARKLLAEGIDPSAHRQAAKRAREDADSFEHVATEFLATLRSTARRSTVETARRRLERYVFPRLGRRPIGDISPTDVLDAVRAIEKAGKHETAHRVLSLVSRVMRYAVTTARIQQNPAESLRGALTASNPKSFAAVTDPKAFGALLLAIDSYSGWAPIKHALQLLALTFVRPGEMRLATWSEIDIDTATWLIPAERMKGRREHVVPLASQAIDVLRELERYRDARGGNALVCPSLRRGRALSDNTFNMALRALGYSGDVHVAHGFRSSASTLLHAKKFDSDTIETQLAHKRPGVAGIYNRSHLIEQRREMMQEWADYLDELVLVG